MVYVLLVRTRRNAVLVLRIHRIGVPLPALVPPVRRAAVVRPIPIVRFPADTHAFQARVRKNVRRLPSRIGVPLNRRARRQRWLVPI